MTPLWIIANICLDHHRFTDIAIDLFILNHMGPKLLSIGETAKFLGISIDTLREWDKKDILKSFRPSPSSKRYYRREDVENFLRKK